MSSVLVEVRELGRVFTKGTQHVVALENISLEIQEGEFVSLMGPSGSGKTTLLNLMAGVDRPTSGSLRVLETELVGMSEDQLATWRNENIGFVFQHFNLIPVLTAFENVELPLLLTSLSKSQRRQHVETALRLVSLTERTNHYPRELSGGEEQRVSIARAIVTDPRLILADEPTGDLDADSAKAVLDILAALNQDFEKTIVMVTHDPKAAAYARTRHYLEKGVLQTQRQAEPVAEF